MKTNEINSSIPSLSTKAAIERQDKHLELHNHIKKIYHTQRLAEDLLSRITGEDLRVTSTAVEEKEPAPTLAQVLNESPAQILNTCNEINRLISCIEEELF